MNGIIAAILLAAGLLPPYFELWQRKGRVIGINFGFLAIDFLGGFFSLMALVAQSIFDPLGSVIFIVCMLLEAGIFASHAIWRIRTRHLHNRAKKLNIPFDALDEAEPYHPPVVRRGSLASTRGREDGSLGQYHRRASMVEALAMQSRRATTAAESRKTSILKSSIEEERVGSKRLASVTIKEEEVVPEDSKTNTETGNVGMSQKNMEPETEGRNSYRIGNSDQTTRGERKPPPGRGDSYFREVDWRHTP